MRCGRHQNQMPIFISSQARNQLVALMACTTPLTAISAGVRFIDNNQFGTETDKIIAASISLDKIGRDHYKWKALKNRLILHTLPFKLRHSTGEHQFSMNMKLLL